LTDTIDQQIHDILDEAHLLFLSMALPGPIDKDKAVGLIDSARQLAQRIGQAGKEKNAQQLFEAANLIEQQLAQRK